MGIDQDKNPCLEFQGLPIAAASIQKKFFSSDNSVSVLHGAFQLNADMFLRFCVFCVWPGPDIFLLHTHARQKLPTAAPGRGKGGCSDRQLQISPHGAPVLTGGHRPPQRKERQDGKGDACFPCSHNIQEEEKTAEPEHIRLRY